MQRALVRRRAAAAGLSLLLGTPWAAAAEPEPGLSTDTDPVAPAAPSGAERPAEEQVPEAPVPAVPDVPVETAPGASAAVVPPRAISTEVVYPSGATASARVLLELVLDREGTVTAVNVVEGDEPFAGAASDAALSWRFEPALRDGRPVPARIRFELRFTPPEPPVPALPNEAAAGEPAAAPAASPVIAPAAPASVQVTEVQVFGWSAPGSASISQADVRVMAGAMGDPFRAVSSLPGVGQLVTGLPVFFVRGAPPGNLGFLVDGVRVPLLFHAFLGPAVIHPKMIERIDLYAGGYPASYGRFAGGIVSADLAQPRGEFNAEWSARLVDAGAFIDVPFAGGRGNLMLAGRYSYTALVLSLLSDLTLDYWDYQALASYELSRKDRVSVFAFGAYDYAATPPDEEQLETAEDGENAVLFHRIDLRYDRQLGEGSQLRAAVTFGTEGTRGGQGLVRDRLAGARLELRSELSDSVLLRAGASAQFDRYELELDPDTENFLDVLALFPGRTDGVLGAYADAVIDAGNGVSVTPGLRVDRYTSQGRVAVGVSPRLAASFRLSPRVSIEHAFGIADQPPNFVPGVPGVAVAGLPRGLQRSVQTSAGVRVQLPHSFTATSTVFNNAFFSLTDPFGQTQDLDLDADEAEVRSVGRAVGLELSLTRPFTQGFGGSLAYTLSRSTRSYERIQTLAGYDRPHVLNVGASLDLGRRWIASARGVLYSGVPGSRALGERRVFDQERARPFVRIDLRMEKR
ncbi:MAG TPA: TonB-dependent receptor, partial [Polyangiaceae bacterium]|nr:TonB-dependent receptor [Polyangiaceae bacterium]